MSDNESSTLSKPAAVSSWNAGYVEELYEQWREDSSRLPESWDMFFRGFEMAMCPRSCVAADRARAQSKVASLMYAYRSEGHLIAQTDPLGDNLTEHPDLKIEKFGFEEADMDKVFDTGHLGGPKRAPLREIVRILRDTYCRSIGVQYTHIQDPAIRRWLQAQMEPVLNKPEFNRDKKHETLELLNDAEMFENFIQTKYPGHKRFSLQGAETLIPAVHAIVELAPEMNAAEIVIGMAHRGRLNVLANILDKSYQMIFSEFDGEIPSDSFGGDGDVKYHLGFSSDHVNKNGKTVHLSLTANPSHLEAVDPVALGKTRAKQRQSHIEKGGAYSPFEKIDRRTVLPLLIHGDAAFIGQGLVSETLNMSQLKGYNTGGTIHFIVNNQIGFTTDPRDARSSAYCTDVMKMLDAPVFHVNGDDPEAVVFVTELAFKFRQEFGRDVAIDMVCYRRFGHNEADEPEFTQPLMYKKIKNRRSVVKIYTQKLLENKDVTKGEVKQISQEYRDMLQKHFDEHTKQEVKFKPEMQDPRWENLLEPFSFDPVDTSISYESLRKITRAITTVPDGFSLNPKIERQLKARLEQVEDKGSLDWGFAELLAFGSLLLERNPVRLSGQDSERGTFSSRHSVWRDRETNEIYIPLNNIEEGQSKYCAYNSPLAEASVLGFDYGYSLAEPRMLILWEAQFGDFANGAQVIIDQFLVSSQSKWQRVSGLVMLLPHGYEGQGPEHSSAYLERYLTSCAQNNIQVCNFTTPAQYFHALRRQLKRPFRRPLIVMSPKSMLRRRLAVSPVKDFTDGKFHEILDDPKPPESPKRLVLCSGKVFYDLYERREKDEIDDVAIVRIEQLYPLHNDMMREITGKYTGLDEIIWVQEETKNRGAWSFMQPWLRFLFPGIHIRYIGRGYSASPATGSTKRHREEQDHIIEAAIHGEKVPYDITILPEGAEKE